MFTTFTDSCFPMIRGQLTSSYDLLIYLPGFLGTPRPRGPKPITWYQRPRSGQLLAAWLWWVYMGLVKTPSPFKWFFHTWSFFSSYRFSKRWLHTFTKGFTWARKGKGKGRVKQGKGSRRGKGEEKGKRTVSHTDHFWYQKLSLSLSFCYRSWFLCAFLFSGNCCNHQKRV